MYLHSIENKNDLIFYYNVNLTENIAHIIQTAVGKGPEYWLKILLENRFKAVI